MTEQDLAKALLRAELNGVEEGAATADLTQQILAKDRRRVRILTWIAGICWIGALCLLYWSTISLVWHHGDLLKPSLTDTDPLLSDLFQAVLVTQASLEGSIFALLCTLLLVFVSRRATLRQVNASLMEISEQLKRLEKKEGSG